MALFSDPSLQREFVYRKRVFHTIVIFRDRRLYPDRNVDVDVLMPLLSDLLRVYMAYYVGRMIGIERHHRCDRRYTRFEGCNVHRGSRV